jgi:hypothetical protein
MELVSGFLLFLGDVFGLKWVRQETNIFRKVLKALTFLVVGVIVVMMYSVIVT